MVTIFRNVALGDPATSTQTSNANELTVATTGRQVFVTGHWFASRSSTSGKWYLLYHAERFRQQRLTIVHGREFRCAIDPFMRFQGSPIKRRVLDA